LSIARADYCRTRADGQTPTGAVGTTADFWYRGVRAMAAGSTSTSKWIVASGILAVAVAVVWLGAPIVPAVIGALGAGVLLYYRSRSRS
jgi:hypothetical protein